MKKFIIKVLTAIFKYLRSGLALIGIIAILLVGRYYFIVTEEVQFKCSSAPQYVQDIYWNIVAVTGESDQIPPIYVLDEPWSYTEVNAFAARNGIYVTRALLEASKNNPDILAGVLGHEISHIILDHYLYSPPEIHKFYSETNEHEADLMGAALMLRAGYNVCNAVEFFKYNKQIYGDSLTSSHPPFSVRIDTLEFPWCNK